MAHKERRGVVMAALAQKARQAAHASASSLRDVCAPYRTPAYFLRIIRDAARLLFEEQRREVAMRRRVIDA